MRHALWIVAVFLALVSSPAAGTTVSTVVDDQGQPLSGARVEVWLVPATESAFERLASALATGETDSKGTVELVAPRDADLLVLVDHPLHPPLLLRAGSLPSELPMQAGAALEGQAVFESSERATEATDEAAALGTACATWSTEIESIGRIRGWERCAPVGADGAFAIAGLPDEQLDLGVVVDGFVPARRRAVASKAGTEPLVVELEAGILVRGRVRDGASGRAVEGAKVTVGELGEAETAADGSFQLTVVRRPTELVADGLGYLERRISLPAEADLTKLDIPLDRGQIVTGDLLDAQGLPLAEGVVWTEQMDRAGQWRTSRHEPRLDDGRFRVELDRPGLHRMRITAEGHRELSVGEITVGPGEELDLGTLLLPRGAGIRGVLIDELTGEGIEGAVVEAVPRGSEIIRQALTGSSSRAVSGADGQFTLTGLEVGGYELRARQAGYATLVRALDMERDEQEDLGELSMGRGVRLMGTVVDRRGAPRPGLRVEIFEGSGESHLPVGVRTADGEGRFEGPNLAPGSYRVNVEGDRLLLVQGLEIPEAVEEHEVELVAGGVSLDGVVVRRGNPVSGGFLVLTSLADPGLRRGLILFETGGSAAASQTVLNASRSQLMADIADDGTFRLEDAPVGDSLVRFYGLDGTEQSRRIEIPDQATARVLVDLDGADLTGRVVDRDVETGLGAAVRLLDASGRALASARSDDSGSFVLDDIQPGLYHLEVTAPGYKPHVMRDLQFGSDIEPLIVRLESGGTGRLLVRLRQPDGSPMARVQFSLLDEAGTMVRSLVSDSAGEKIFDDLPEGQYSVVWSSSLAGTGISAPIQVNVAEPAVFDATIPMAGPVSLACAPELCAGASLRQVQVYSPSGLDITSYLSGTHVGMRFSDGGRLSLGRLTPGRYLVQAGVSDLQARQVIEVDRSGVVVALQ